jgi:glycosyltransferase involved in cell wall biosynthesis
MINVLQLIHAFIEGGSERQMIQLTKLLLESGKYRVHVACLDGTGALRQEIDRLGFSEVAEFPLTSFYDSNMLLQLRRFRDHVRKRDIRLVHTHDFYSNIFGMAGSALSGVPVRMASRRETQGMRTQNQKRGELLAFKLAHRIIANAEAVRDQLLLEGVPGKKISVVYNGLDLARLTPQSSTRSEILTLLGLSAMEETPGLKFVTIVANLKHDVKDHPMFLRAARRIQAAVPEARFLIAGTGELLAPMRALAAELGIGSHSFFLGRCAQVPELLSISDVCVLSSKAEGFSNAILEYMAAEKPVVATNVGGAREAVIEGETGYLVASNDDEKMAQRIVDLLRNPELALSMGQAGRRRVETRFSCQAQLGKTEQIYEELLRRTKSSKPN